MEIALRSAIDERAWQPARGLNHVFKLIRPFLADMGNDTADQPVTRVAVLGLYRSGSTAVAGVLHHLGVDMGSPFFFDYYESAWLSQKLRVWWNEPENEETTPAAKRVSILKRWIQKQEHRGSKWIGMKHPLLSLCGPDLLTAWGRSTRFVWTCRPLENSIKSLVKLKWWNDSKSEETQRSLWVATTEFLSNREHLRIDFADMMVKPRQQVQRLADYLGLKPSAERINRAASFIQPTSNE